MPGAATRRRLLLALWTALLLSAMPPALAESGDRLARARSLYAQAAYAEALEAMSGVPGLEAHRYRALCLLALGRVKEAELSLEAIVLEAPGHFLPETEVPPRLLQLFADARERILPSAIRDVFAAGREQFQRGDFQQARVSFRHVLTLVLDPAVDDAPLVTDLELLAAGYLDLTDHVEAKRLPVRASLAAQVPPGRAPQLETPPPPDRPAVIVPAVTLHQQIPTYVTAAGGGVPRLTAAIRVVIDTAGSVVAASIERSVDPRYDAQLLSAARGWSFEPATRGGVPIRWEQVVEVRLGR